MLGKTILRGRKETGLYIIEEAKGRVLEERSCNQEVQMLADKLIIERRIQVIILNSL